MTTPLADISTSAPPSTSVLSSGDIGDVPPVRILIVDDETDLRNTLATFLSRVGCEVMTACEGGEGLQLLFFHHFDVVVSDLAMAPMDGITFLDEARKIWPWIGAVIISGYMDENRHSRAAALGVNFILEKPFSVADLQSAVFAEANRVRGSVRCGHNVSIQHLRHQLNLLGESIRAAMEAISLEQALEQISFRLARELPAVATAIMCLPVADCQPILAVSVRDKIAPAYLARLENLMRERYRKLSGADMPSELELRFPEEQMSPDGIPAFDNAVTFPFIDRGIVIGILAVVPPGGYECSEYDTLFLSNAANQVTTVMMAFFRIRNVAMHDQLTGLYNRHHLNEAFNAIMGMARRHGFHVGVMMIDIDNCKSVNDTYGHAVGDEVLRETSGLARTACRSSDLLFRFGGDEFVVLLPDATPDCLGALSHRLLDLVRKHAFGNRSHALRCTISIGAAGIRLGDEVDVDSETLLARADEALYAAKRNSGGILMVGGRVQDCLVFNNSVTPSTGGNSGQGGGIHASGGALIESTLVTSNRLFTGTATTSRGGGVFLSGSVLRNSLIFGNSHNTYDGNNYYPTVGGVHAEGASTIESCTIADNFSRLASGSGGLYNSGCDVLNTIINNNRDHRGINNYRNAGTAWSYQNCLTTPLVDGEGNLDLEQSFRAPSIGDYRLRPGPAVDAGSYAAWMDESFDLGGTARIEQESVDIGAYEYLPEALECSFSAAETTGVVSLEAVFNSMVDGTNTVGLFYNWSFINGASDDISGSGRAVVTNIYPPGLYSVRLTVTNLAGEVATAVREDYIRVSPATIYVASGGTPTYPYESWATAATNIHDAVAAAVGGSLILVSNGTYQITRQIFIDQGVAMRSVNGAEFTTIERLSGSFNLLFLSHPEAVADGFTITKSVLSGVEIEGGGSLLNSIVRDNLHNNSDPRVGGGVWLKDDGLIQNCQIFNNKITYSGGHNGFGGGVYLTRGGTIDTCVITNNTVGTGSGSSHGGGIYMNGGTMRGSLVAGNEHIKQAGGVYATGGAVIESCTIVGNYCPAVTAVGGLYNDGTLRNSIVAFNDNGAGLANYAAGASGTCIYSCIDPAPGGEGNTALDPQLTDRINHDYTIQPGPCVDSGIDQEWMVNAEDLGGNPRIVGTAVDMGAFEYVPGELVCAFEGTPLAGLGSLEVKFSAAVGGGNLDGLFYKWSFCNSGSYDVEGLGRAVVTNTYLPGLYSVRLTVSNAADEVATAIRERYVKVAPPVAHVSTNGASVIPYDTWATAATNIHDAVAMSTDGGVILVSNGTYSITSPIEIHQGIALRSVNGPAVTIIRRHSGNSGLLYVTSSGALVEGFTFREANMDPVVHLDTGGTLSNCVIRDNDTPYTQATAGLRIAGPAIARNCIIINNYNRSTTTVEISGGGVHMTGTGGLVEGCVITNNFAGGGEGRGFGGGVYMSGNNTLRNSLVAANRHIGHAGGVYCSGGTVENCTIVDNSTINATRITGEFSTVGGILAVGATVRNCIIHNNLWQDEVFNHDSFGTPSFQHCLTEPVAGLVGFGNIEGGPRFKDLASGKFTIMSDSPAINTGTNQLWMAGAVDLAGQQRIRHKLVDIGAYEGRLPGATVLLLR